MARENGFSPVKSYFMTPEQIADMDRKVREKNEGPKPWKWERTMTKEQYLQAMREGHSRQDIVLMHFNNDPNELRAQLKDWGITEAEAVKMAQGKKVELTITKQEYLQRRLNGEKRSHIIRSLGVATPRAYELLKEWGIRELDAEERELELLAPSREAKEIDKRVSEELEQKSEAREMIAYNEQQQELAELQAAAALWKNDAEQKDKYIKDLEEELTKNRTELERERLRLQSVMEQDATEISRLNDALSRAADVSDQTSARIKELEAERNLLLQTIEQAASDDGDFITLRLPILSVVIANVERSRIYEAIEALSTGVEAADIDRGRVMTELFDLLQRVVNFVTADLAELHPSKNVSGFVREFFSYYNDRHLGLLTEIRQAS
ncbi:hypothetical protein [Paenibacillus sp. GXUN7292]|uniref:hypothetical protein n=1 Tax=Paenibacillus sp. GXUN7292 TaxID=3422499 RepID=UPI003D7D2ABA